MQPRKKMEQDSPPEDPRIDELRRECARLSQQVTSLTEQIQRQSDTPSEPPDAERSKVAATVGEILDELHQQQAQISQDDPLHPAESADPKSQAVPVSPAGGAEAQRQDSPKRTRVKTEPSVENSAKKSGAGEVISTILFYVVLIAILLGVVILRGGGSGAPISIAGYTPQLVLTSSMEDVIPKGSLVISKKVDPNTLQIGDDITYMVSQTSTITHRIIGITENYSNTGQRAFETQGVMNEAPDKELVPAVNVVGKVVFHSAALGKGANFVKQNWPLLLFLLVLLVILTKVLQRIQRSDLPDSGGAEEDTSIKKDKHFLGG